MKDFLFVDAVSGRPVKNEEKVRSGPRPAKRSNILAMFVALVAFILLLATWALS